MCWIKFTGDLKLTLDILSSWTFFNLNECGWVERIEKRSYVQLRGNFILTLYFLRSVMSVWKKKPMKRSQKTLIKQDSYISFFLMWPVRVLDPRLHINIVFIQPKY